MGRQKHGGPPLVPSTSTSRSLRRKRAWTSGPHAMARSHPSTPTAKQIGSMIAGLKPSSRTSSARHA
eukprot:10976911-Heterocapsa_arctica.AAC.1